MEFDGILQNLIEINGQYLKTLYEPTIYVNHRGHDRGKKNTGERERVMGVGRWGGGGDHSLSPVFFHLCRGLYGSHIW